MSRAVGHAGVLGGHPRGIQVHRHPLLLLGLFLASAAVFATMALRPATGHQSGWLLDETNGPHVAVSALPGADLQPVTRLPGAVSSSGPFAGMETSLRHGGVELGLYVEARPAQPSAVDRPALRSGEWLPRGAIVLQDSAAKRLAVAPGDHVSVTTTGRTLRLLVAGVADSTLSRRYPGSSDGVGYVLPETLSRIAPDEHLYTRTLMIRLADPDASSSFAQAVRNGYRGPEVSVFDWRRP